MTRITANQIGAAAILLAVATVTSAQGSITTETDLTGLTATVVTDGVRNVKITLDMHMYSTVATDFWTINIKEGATIIHQYQGPFKQNSGQEHFTFIHVFTAPPSAGSHTYKATLTRASGSGTLNTFSSTDRKDQLIVEHI